MTRRIGIPQLLFSVTLVLSMPLAARGSSGSGPDPETAVASFHPADHAGRYQVEAKVWSELSCTQRREALRALARVASRRASPVLVFVEGRLVASHDGRVAVFYPDLRRGEVSDLQMLRDSNDPAQVDVPPALVSMPMPEYPREAREQGIEGSLSLRALVGTEGRIEEIILPQGAELPGLTEAAIAAAREALFRPARRADRPVAVWTLVPFEFVID
jgi:protein TonB